MQGRSWMAALTVVAGIMLPHSLPRTASAEGKTAEKSTQRSQVVLNLAILGLSSQGCHVEIKPANTGSRFTPIRQHVSAQGTQKIHLKDVSTSSADRECSIAITIHEPGQRMRTVRRGLRLAAPESGTASVLECFIPSPSELARNEIGKETQTR